MGNFLRRLRWFFLWPIGPRRPPIADLRTTEEAWARQFVFYMQAMGAGLVHDPTTLGTGHREGETTHNWDQFAAYTLKWTGHDGNLYGMAYQLSNDGGPFLTERVKDMAMQRALAIEFPRCVEALHG